MSFNINSDKEFISGSQPKLIGESELTIRSGIGSSEKEIIRTQLDAVTGLPRVGINRTGQRVNTITIVEGGSGYTSEPSVTISAPSTAGGVQALGSAFVDFTGAVSNIAVNNPGSGYTSPPTITITGGGGGGATATSVLDTVDFELDINGAIRTSTSIISDTARILNLDIENFVTPNADFRAPNLKTFMNNTGIAWSSGVIIQKDSYRWAGPNTYQALNTGVTGSVPPTHTDGIILNGEVQLKHIGYRVIDENAFGYNETGDAGIYPRSITPLLGDRTDKIATTEYVLNLATNDVGGRVYVSAQIGSDLNDGRSAVNPVRSIKKAAQLAWSTPGIKETIIVSGGDYVEDNPISLPPDCSVVGDNLRLVIIRPANPGKHIMKFGDKNYVIGVTYRDQIDSVGDAVATWDFAMVFDDKQRIIIDNEVNGDFGVNFPIGHQIFGPDQFRVDFQENTGLSNLQSGLEIVGLNTGSRAKIIGVVFNTTTGAQAYLTGKLDFTLTSGSFLQGESFRYLITGSAGSSISLTITQTAGENTFRTTDDPTTLTPPGSYIFLDDADDSSFTQGFYEVKQIDDDNSPSYWDVTVVPVLNSPGWDTTISESISISQANIVTEQVDTTSLKSIRAEGEVVSVDEDITTTLPIQRLDFSLQGDPSIATGGFQNEQFGNAEDLGGIVFYTNDLIGRSNIHDFKEGQEIIIEGLPTVAPDLSVLNGKQRIYKVLEDADGRARRFVIPKKLPALTDSNFDPGQVASVKSYSKSITLSLLNSPSTFATTTPVERRFQDACVFLRNNREFIADEVVGKINDQFKREYYSVYNISGNSFDIYLGTLNHANTWISGGTVTSGATTVNVTGFTYDTSITGVATVTTDNPIPGLSEDDTVQLADLLIECDSGQKIYPSYSSPTSGSNTLTNGDTQCRQDVIHFINALVRDLEFGSNHNVIEAASKYIVNGRITYIEDEIVQNARAIEYARELAIFAMRNWRTGNGTTGDPTYIPQYSSITRYFDDTVITSTAGTPACDDVRSAIDTLAYLWADVITNDSSGTYLDAAYLIARNRDLIADQALINTESNFPSFNLSDLHQRKCRRDINYILTSVIRDLVLGGNDGIVENAEIYFSGTALTGIDASQLEETRYAYTQVRDLSIAAMRNWKDSAGNSFTTTSPIPQFTDSSILADPLGNPLCANVETSLSTIFGTLDGILEYADDPASGTAIEPGVTVRTYGSLFDTSGIITYPDSFIYDQNNQRMSIRADYDDYPIIEASPYTQNASVISFLGGGGAEVDGDKVKQPNCPFPGLELDGTASFPNQGKSMVASAFTIVSFGGTGYKVINDGYTQLVSVFVIFCADGVLAESGGYCSITNSATNFGVYALRGIGFRKEAYEFDSGTIGNVSSTPTGRTILTVNGLGREPLEHYIVKIDGYSNTNVDIEYFVDSVDGVTVGPPFSAQLTLDNGTGDSLDLTRDSDGAVIGAPPIGSAIKLHRPSIVNSSSHTWEFAGSGTNYLALPENGGTKNEANEQVSQQYGRVYVSGTDELGDFKVGTFAKIENRTGNITFTGTVTISEVEFLKLKGGDTVVTGFDASNTLGGANSSDSKLPTQKAVRDYITNNLGPYINKPYSTNAVPRALVELTDSGKISVDQIPALRPFEVFTVNTQSDRLALEGALAGDIAIQNNTDIVGGTPQSFILNNDLDSQFLGFNVDTSLQFTIGDIFTGSISGARLQATEYRQGVVYQVNVTEGGSGYSSPPTVTLSGGTPQSGSVEAKATSIIANGEVVAIDIIVFNNYSGGKGYTTPPVVTIAAPAGSGVQATANSVIESRLYGDIVNRIKVEDTDSIDSSDIPAVTIAINRVINTSGSNANNWVGLSSNQISVGDLTGPGLMSTTLLGAGAANSFTFLRGDQSYALAVQSIKGAETRYFAKLLVQANSSSQSLVFPIVSDALVGHEVLDNVIGIQPDTNITGILTDGTAGTTTISIDNPLTSSIAAGTIIEFIRDPSPIIFDSSYTQGNYVDKVIISNGGTGFTNGQYFDVGLSGGTGTGLKGNIIVSGGTVTSIIVTDGGSGFNADFDISVPPVEIGGGSSFFVLGKISTINKQFANVAIDVQRVSDATTNDPFGTAGVARFKKNQFIIGASGNGSIELDVGADSGLDADLLDGQQGAYYTSATNLFTGTVPSDRLAGTYNISVSGSSGNTLRLATGTNNPVSNPSPDNFASGVVSNTVNNSANSLNDGGTKNMVLTFRAGGSSFDSSFGGVRQLAFTDSDNMYLRGSGTSVTAFGSWAKIWTSLNDGINSGLDADRLDNKQGLWYQNALNINYGTISDNRLPRFISATSIKDDVTIKSFNGDSKFKIYLSGQILNTTPFTPGNNVNLYDSNGQGTGVIAIDNILINDESDNFNDYTIIVGRLTTGNFIGAVTIGDAGNRKEFDDFTIEDGNTIEVAKLESDGGTANLRLGRKDGSASSPGVYFNSAVLAANYNAAIIATGGNATDGSGSLNVLVENADALNVNGNIVWNAGNIAFQSTNVADTAVKRDSNGDFAAGTITADLIGSSSLNVLKAGDTMTGGLTIGSGGTAPTTGLRVEGETFFQNTVSIVNDFTVDTDTLFVDVSNDAVGINVGTTLTAGIGLDVLGGAIAALRLSGPANPTGHQLLLDGSRDTYYDNADHAMMFITSGSATAAYKPSEGAHWIFNGRAQNRDFVFRNNSSNKLTIQGDGGLLIENSGTNYAIEADKKVLFREGVFLDSGNDNSGTFVTMFGAANYRNFRISAQTTGNDLFAIQASNSDGNNNWNTTPAIQIKGDTNAVAINTTAHSGTDPDDGTTVRQYKLNVQGDVNFNGQLFQNNAEFVTSRWTESPNEVDIYRPSRVGIGFSSAKNPDQALEVQGSIEVTEFITVNDDKQYLDSYGIVKRNRNTIAEDVTIGGSDNAASYGPITIQSGSTVTISSGGVWNIL
jgi:hypothetical protein